VGGYKLASECDRAFITSIAPLQSMIASSTRTFEQKDGAIASSTRTFEQKDGAIALGTPHFEKNG
jgi:hypothetical protein